MSRETLQTLNNQTLIGFTEKRGNAWHYRAEQQGAEPNHYPMAVPTDDVLRRLFHWQAVEGQIRATAITADGVIESVDPVRKAVMRSDTGAIMGIHSAGYEIHQFSDWLLNSVADMLDDSLSIGSAGLLRGGAVAWVQIEVPENIKTSSGVEFRPNLLACTSHDGTLATTYQRTVTNVVCDNTMSAALREDGQRLRVKHSRNSSLRLGEARQALEIVHTISADFEAQVEQLTNVAVSEGDWSKFLESLAPVEDKKGRGLTMAQNKQDALTGLWNADPRVAPWKGTAWGVVQAVNTFVHHESSIHGGEDMRAERNMQRAVSGGVDVMDRKTMAMLDLVLA